MEAGAAARLTAADGRKFALTLGLGFAALALVSRWRGHVIPPYVLGALGVLLVAAGILIPSHLTPLHRAWMGLAHALSRVTTPVLMAVLYFVVLTPIAVVRRAFGANPLQPPAGDSLWVSRPRDRRRSDLERQF